VEVNTIFTRNGEFLPGHRTDISSVDAVS